MTNQSTMTIPEAAEVLGITGRVSLKGIHLRFHDLVKEWHPDVSRTILTFHISRSSG